MRAVPDAGDRWSARDLPRCDLLGVDPLEEVAHRGAVGLGHPRLLLALADQLGIRHPQMLQDSRQIGSGAVGRRVCLHTLHHELTAFSVPGQ